jgi:hypothetical protein
MGRSPRTTARRKLIDQIAHDYVRFEKECSETTFNDGLPVRPQPCDRSYVFHAAASYLSSTVSSPVIGYSPLLTRLDRASVGHGTRSDYEAVGFSAANRIVSDRFVADVQRKLPFWRRMLAA